LKIIQQFLGYLRNLLYVSTVIEREMMMKNVKELLKRWKYELAEEEMSCTTDWTEEQFEDFGTMIEELEEAITKDGNTIGKWEVVGEPTKHNLKF
jgi:hypothetical protein